MIKSAFIALSNGGGQLKGYMNDKIIFTLGAAMTASDIMAFSTLVLGTIGTALMALAGVYRIQCNKSERELNDINVRIAKLKEDKIKLDNEH